MDTRIVHNIFNEIKELVDASENKKENKLRYKIGEKLSHAYIKIKESSKQFPEDLNRQLKEFNKNHGIQTEKKYDKMTFWDKVKFSLSASLESKFKDQGYGVTNLGYMQQFYRKYRNTPDNLELAMQLDWSHNVELLKDKLIEDERRFYLKRATQEKWTLKKLVENIKTELYEEYLRVIEGSQYKFSIESMTINNYKSLENISLKKPSPFLVFAGSNATGKSSIFEALEFLMHSAMTMGDLSFNIFGGKERVINYDAQAGRVNNNHLSVELELGFEYENTTQQAGFAVHYDISGGHFKKNFSEISDLDSAIANSFSRIYINNPKRADGKLKSFNKLWLDASNLNTILKKVLAENNKKNDVLQWVKALVPEIESITVETDISGRDELKIFEKAFPDKPFTGGLISEGTFNIIAIITLLFQSDKPQFICIEEPETGLNPAMLRELIPFFREMVEKYHHHIWITTHSTSLVAELLEEELVIVNKKNGKTQLYPCKPGDFEEMRPDEAWMNNMLKGGGLPW